MILTVFVIECDGGIADKRSASCQRLTQIYARGERDAEAKYKELGGKVETVDTGGGYKQKHTCPSCR